MLSLTLLCVSMLCEWNTSSLCYVFECYVNETRVSSCFVVILVWCKVKRRWLFPKQTHLTWTIFYSKSKKKLLTTLTLLQPRALEFVCWFCLLRTLFFAKENKSSQVCKNPIFPLYLWSFQLGAWHGWD